MNKYKDHLIIVAEDEALHAVVNGFLLNNSINTNTCKLMPYSRGWTKVEDQTSGYSRDLEKTPCRRVLFVIDFDKNGKRLNRFKCKFPQELHDRMFVIGPWSNVENLKTCLGSQSCENVGRTLSEACPINSKKTGAWSCKELSHITSEAQRLCENVKNFLFKA